MILSYKHNFIFIKTNKTASTSIEVALSKFCGQRDIITPINDEDEVVRKKPGFRKPRNYTDADGNILFYNHISAKRVRDIIKSDTVINPKVWSKFYKFCFERNPWDRAISLYYWRYQEDPRPSLSEFIASDELAEFAEKSTKLYMQGDNVLVDRICRYENLEEELEIVRNQVGIPEKIVLPQCKTNARKDKRHYRELLSDADRDRIAELFAKGIELMGYEY